MTANVSSENYSVPNIFTPPPSKKILKNRDPEMHVFVYVYIETISKRPNKQKSLRRVYFFLKWSLIKSVTLTWCFHFPCHKQYIKFE